MERHLPILKKLQKFTTVADEKIVSSEIEIKADTKVIGVVDVEAVPSDKFCVQINYSNVASVIENVQRHTRILTRKLLLIMC